MFVVTRSLVLNVVVLEKAEVFANVREMLSMAESGCEDAVSANPNRRRPGLMNLMTYGRSVTFAIQTLKGLVSGFDDWWLPYQEWMKNDPLMSYFNDARVDITHKGALKTSSSVQIGKDGPVDMGSLIRNLSRNAPPHTVGIFLGEGTTGGSGWEVEMSDGSKVNIYFELPTEFDIQSSFHLTGGPTMHDGKELGDSSAQQLSTLYMSALRRIVDEFEERWK
jgi:hypothetical protein